MHDLMEFVCNELKEIGKKAKNSRLSMQEVQYADVLAHLKKDLLTAEAMEKGEEYSHDYSYRRGRDSMGRYTSRDEGSYRYSRDDEIDDLEKQLHSMEQNATNEDTRRKIRDMIRQLKC